MLIREVSMSQQVWWNYFCHSKISQDILITKNFFFMIWYENFILTHRQHVLDPLSFKKCFSLQMDFIWFKVLFWCFSNSIFRKKNDEDVLNDIDNMLQGLTEELDAMLEEELVLDEWFCHALPKKVEWTRTTMSYVLFILWTLIHFSYFKCKYFEQSSFYYHLLYSFKTWLHLHQLSSLISLDISCSRFQVADHHYYWRRCEFHQRISLWKVNLFILVLFRWRNFNVILWF